MIVGWRLAIASARGVCRTPGLTHSCSGLIQRRRPVTTWTGELMAASATCSGRWLEVADLIVGRDRSPEPDAADGWLAWAMTRFPGCAVAAIETVGACRVGTRGGTAMTLAVRGAGPKPLVGGCLAHAWLAAGHPVAALDSARFRMAFRGSPGGWDGRGHGGGTALSFSLSVLGEQPGTGPSVSSRERIWAAWAAPRSS